MFKRIHNLLANFCQRYRIKNFISFLAQAATGKQGVLGPTKIYLAVQPVQPSNNQQQQQQTSQVSSTASTPMASTPKQQQPIVSPPPATGTQFFNILLLANIYTTMVE